MTLTQRECTSCKRVFTTNSSTEAFKCLVCEGAENGTRVPLYCKHEWVWSGVPRGSVWCKKCDVDYEERYHGILKDMSETGYGK